MSEIDWFRVKSGDALTLVRRGRAETLSYAKLRAQAEMIAAQLSDARIAPGDLLALGVSSPVKAVKLIYGALWYGSALLPFDSALPSLMRNRLLELAACPCVISDTPITELPTSTTGLSYSQLLDGKRPQILASHTPSSAEALSLIVATSGSSGEPKGVMLSAGNLWASACAANSRLELTPGGRWLNTLPLRHIGGLSIIYRCLQAGAEMVLLDAFDAAEVWRQICHQGITHLSLVPTMLFRLLEVSGGAAPPPGFRVALVGGGALSAALAATAVAQGWPLCVTYGMSETASQVACTAPPGELGSAGYVGHVLDGFAIRVDTDGRLAVKGPAVMSGYLNPQQARGQGLTDGWFKTDDLGRIDNQGGVHVVGRADSVLISGGVNVQPALVEQQLIACPGVIEVAILGVADAQWGTTLVAIYAGGAQPEAIRWWSRTNLSGAECPKRFIQINELPRDSMGKVIRDQLQGFI